MNKSQERNIAWCKRMIRFFFIAQLLTLAGAFAAALSFSLTWAVAIGAPLLLVSSGGIFVIWRELKQTLSEA